MMTVYNVIQIDIFEGATDIFQVKTFQNEKDAEKMLDEYYNNSLAYLEEGNHPDGKIERYKDGVKVTWGTDKIYDGYSRMEILEADLE